MGRIELDDQSDIIDSIIVAGGYAKKWATMLQVGMPDIIGAVPSVGMFLMEVKSFVLQHPEHLHEAMQRDLDENVTTKQRYELKRFAEAGAFCMLGIVLHFYYEKDHAKTLHIVPWDSDSIIGATVRTVSEWRFKRFESVVSNIQEVSKWMKTGSQN